MVDAASITIFVTEVFSGTLVLQKVMAEQRKHPQLFLPFYFRYIYPYLLYIIALLHISCMECWCYDSVMLCCYVRMYQLPS